MAGAIEPGTSTADIELGILPSPIYVNDEMSNELRQGEILTGIKTYIYDPGEDVVTIKVISYAIVISQDCDLLRDFDDRRLGKTEKDTNLLFIEGFPAAEARQMVPQGSDIWKRIIHNKDERYHLLEAIPSVVDLLGSGAPAVIFDFRDLFMLRAHEIYRQIGSRDVARRARLAAPYREHLQSRAAFYLQRVMLPVDHRLPTPAR